MIKFILIVLGILIAIPIVAIVIWNAIKLVFAIIVDLGNLIWAILFIGFIFLVIALL